MNRLYFGDNLKWLSDRKEFPDTSVDLVYLDPPFNSNADYNVLFREPSEPLETKPTSKKARGSAPEKTSTSTNKPYELTSHRRPRRSASAEKKATRLTETRRSATT